MPPYPGPEVTVSFNIPQDIWTNTLSRILALGTPAPIIAAISELKQELRTMSASLTQQLTDGIKTLTDQNAAITASVGQVSASVMDLDGDIKELKTELESALASVKPGSQITQEQVDALNAAVASATDLAGKSSALADAAKASADQFPDVAPVPVEPAPPVDAVPVESAPTP